MDTLSDVPDNNVSDVIMMATHLLLEISKTKLCIFQQMTENKETDGDYDDMLDSAVPTCVIKDYDSY